MQVFRSFLRIVEYLSIAGILLIGLLFYLGNLGYANIKMTLLILDVLVCIFVFLNCTDDYKTPFEKLFRFIGWLVLLTGIFIAIIIYEGFAPAGIWEWLNTILVLGLFAAQLSEINEMKRTRPLFVFLNFIIVAVTFSLLVCVIHAIPVNFTLLFAMLIANLAFTLLTVFTGKIKS